MESKHTPVQWFAFQLGITNGTLLEKAMEIEKEHLLDAHIEGQRVFDKHPHTQWTTDQSEQYYTETYGGGQ